MTIPTKDAEKALFKRTFWTHFAISITVAILGAVTIGQPPAVKAAEKISFTLPMWGEFTLSADSLDIFAREGRITPEFAYYAQHLDRETLAKFRQVLQIDFDVDPVTIYRLTNLPMGEDFLQRLGNIIYTHPGRNGLYAIRSALILAAAEPEGLTAITFLRHFPTAEMQLNIKAILALVRETETWFRYRDSSIRAIAQQAEMEIKTQLASNRRQLPDLDRPGSFKVVSEVIAFTIEDQRQTPKGFLNNYELNADLYFPEKLAQAAPLTVITHGWGANPADYDYLAQHLASHGYIVAVPEHSGSSDRYQAAYLKGEVGVDVSPTEFYSRPRDITHLLDQLEQHPRFKRRINWSQVGAIGHSLGGTTALTTAGAPLNLARINQTCAEASMTVNASTILQCRAQDLPPGNYQLQDRRIKAVIAFNPVISSILGVESLQQIEIPTLILGGSADLIAPFIQEQAHPFLWLTTADKYLATVVNGTHLTSSNQDYLAAINNLTGSKSKPDTSKNYLKALSLAFLEAHTRDRPQYKSYLTAAYAEQISDPELPLHLIRSLTPKQLELAYGKIPPQAPIPQPLVNIQSSTNSSILADAASSEDPAQKDDWVSYFQDLAAVLSDRLTTNLE